MRIMTSKNAKETWSKNHEHKHMSIMSNGHGQMGHSDVHMCIP